MELTGHTQLLCLIGSPVSHSGSPAMYNYCFDKFNIDCAYMAFDIKEEDCEKAFQALRILNCKGFNITMPLKTRALELCDELATEAMLIGAVNTVVNVGGRLIGHNTDGYGFVRNLREHGFEIKGKKMTITGSGGAATAIEITSALEGVREISIFAMNDSFFKNAENTVRKIHENIPSCTVNLYDLQDRELFKKEIQSSDLFTNATKVGMKPMDEMSLIEDMSLFRKDLTVADVVYNPRKTKLICDAEKYGSKTVPGIGMLLWQGSEAFKLYFDMEMPVSEIEKKYFM